MPARYPGVPRGGAIRDLRTPAGGPKFTGSSPLVPRFRARFERYRDHSSVVNLAHFNNIATEYLSSSGNLSKVRGTERSGGQPDPERTKL